MQLQQYICNKAHNIQTKTLKRKDILSAHLLPDGFTRPHTPFFIEICYYPALFICIKVFRLYTSIYAARSFS